MSLPDKDRGCEEGISLCGIYRNEAQNLESFLKSHLSLFEQVVLVDTGSTDHSEDIVRDHGLAHHLFPWTGNFAQARNHSLELANQAWVVVLDIDEQMLPGDVAKLRVKMAGAGRDAFSLHQVTFVDTVEDLGWRSIETLPEAFHKVARGYVVSPLIRAFRNRAGVCFEGAIHELVGPSLGRLGLSSCVTDIPVYHYGWVGSARTDLEKLEKRLMYARMIRQQWERNPSPQMAFYYVSTLGDPGERLRLLYRLTRQYPEVKQFWEMMAQSAVGLEQFGRALSYVDQGLARHPDDQTLLMLRARLLNETGSPGDALAILDLLLGRDPHNPLLLQEKTRACLLLERSGAGGGSGLGN